MIGFVLEDNRVRLEVNRAAAESAGLHVSSKLLAVARLVKPDGAEMAGRADGLRHATSRFATS